MYVAHSRMWVCTDCMQQTVDLDAKPTSSSNQPQQPQQANTAQSEEHTGETSLTEAAEEAVVGPRRGLSAADKRPSVSFKLLMEQTTLVVSCLVTSNTLYAQEESEQVVQGVGQADAGKTEAATQTHDSIPAVPVPVVISPSVALTPEQQQHPYRRLAISARCAATTNNQAASGVAPQEQDDGTSPERGTPQPGPAGEWRGRSDVCRRPVSCMRWLSSGVHTLLCPCVQVHEPAALLRRRPCGHECPCK